MKNATVSKTIDGITDFMKGNEKSKYYHISLDIENVVSEFQPQVPSAIHEFEDGTIKRICLSDSIDGCLSGVPFGGRKLEGMTAEFQGMLEDAYPDVDHSFDYSLPFRVYEFDLRKVKKKNFYSTERLLNDGLVLDADTSGEVWVVEENLVPTDTYVVLLTEFMEEPGDVFSQKYHQAGGDVDDIDEHILGMTTRITETELKRYPTYWDVPFHIVWPDWKEKMAELKDMAYEV